MTHLVGIGATDATREAMMKDPDYWLRWYTFKSLALVAAVAGLAYMIGREHGRSR